MKQIKLLSVVLSIGLLLAPLAASDVQAITSNDLNAIINQHPYYDPAAEETAKCTTDSTPGLPSLYPVDYAGNPIFPDAVYQSMKENQFIYQLAASTVNIPWQMLAVIHVREHSALKDNPDNGQGAYQFAHGEGGPYPTGPIDDAEFTRQSILAAQFIVTKAVGANYPANRNLTAGSNTDTIKDTFFSYNGRAPQYAQQAASLGYDPNTQGFEGSPYVMNRADAARDPNVNTTTWGQIKTDFSTVLEYPANGGAGAFVMYAALTGLPLATGSCGSTAVTSGFYAWPESGPTNIASCFGYRPDPFGGLSLDFHPGVDISGGAGTPIVAAADGVVTYSGPATGYGPNFVVIKHNNGYGTSYGHMATKTVEAGATVTKGQQIGTEGNEGHSTGYHVHLNLFPGDYAGSDNNNVDPLQNGFTIPTGTTNPNDCH